MSEIDRVDAKLFRIPLAETLSDAKHGDHTHFELITATVRLRDGRDGTGYTYTGGRGGHAIRAMIEHDLGPFLLGKEAADVCALYDEMLWHVHYVGRGVSRHSPFRRSTLRFGISAASRPASRFGKWPAGRGEPAKPIAGG